MEAERGRQKNQPQVETIKQLFQVSPCPSFASSVTASSSKNTQFKVFLFSTFMTAGATAGKKSFNSNKGPLLQRILQKQHYWN